MPVPVAIVSSSRRVAFEDRLDGAVDGDLLIVALALPDGVVGRREQTIGTAVVAESAACRDSAARVRRASDSCSQHVSRPVK